MEAAKIETRNPSGVRTKDYLAKKSCLAEKAGRKNKDWGREKTGNECYLFTGNIVIKMKEAETVHPSLELLRTRCLALGRYTVNHHWIR